MPFSPPRLLPLALVACAACGAAPQPDAREADPARVSPVAPVADPPPAAAAPAEGDSAQAIRSVWTSLKADDCTMVSVDEEAGGSTQRCAGTAGYALLALEGDARMSITVVTPAGAEQPLEFWTTATGAFTTLGDSAEWRLRGDEPVALIVPLRANEDPENPERVTPYRIIAKITAAQSCVTHRLPGATPDAQARRLADAAAAQPCITSYADAAGTGEGAGS